MSTENKKQDFEWNDSLVQEYAQFILEDWHGETKQQKLEEFKALKGEKRSPEYEILSFIGVGPCNKGSLFKLDPEDGRYYCSNWKQLKLSGLRLSDLSDDPEVAVIHSVKRLSDGEVFQIGDKLDWEIGDDPRIDAFIPNYKGNALWLSTNKEYGCGCALNHATKLPTPKPLFTTEDGVDLFSISDTVYGVCPKGTWETRELGLLLEPNKTNWKWFAIPYNRDRYILMNKPTLSVNEVLDIFRDHEVFDELVSALQERAKAKL